MLNDYRKTHKSESSRVHCKLMTVERAGPDGLKETTRL